MRFSTGIFTSALLAVSSVVAHPSFSNRIARDVVAPHITYPIAGVTLPIGSKQKVTWDITGLENSTSTAVLLLGKIANSSENLDIEHPLASQIPIKNGFVDITIPKVSQTGHNYIVVLIGDSGDRSSEFSIEKA